MLFIRPSYEILNIPDATEEIEVYKHLERIGRVCYKSEEKITEESCHKYLEMLRERKHWAMLEHYIFVMRVSREIYFDIQEMKYLYDVEDDPDIIHRLKFINTTHSTSYNGEYLVSGSATSFNYLWECESIKKNSACGIAKICRFLQSKFSLIMKIPDGLELDENISKDISLLTRKEIESLPKNLRLIHDSMSVKFTVNRGVTHELVRHRPASWAQESTRYVNYGKKGYTFILPCWISEKDKDILMDEEKLEHIITTGSNDPNELSNIFGIGIDTLYYLISIVVASDCYDILINKNGWMPQQARSVLPNDTKAEIIMTANMYEWRHFFDMRAEDHAHVQMREVVCPLLDQVGNPNLDVRGVLFEDQRDKYISYEKCERNCIMKLNKQERAFNLHPVGIKYICENCNEGEMIIDKDNPIILTSNPPLIPHKCNKCGCEMRLMKTYPYVEWMTDEEYEKYVNGGNDDESADVHMDSKEC